MELLCHKIPIVETRAWAAPEGGKKRETIKCQIGKKMWRFTRDMHKDCQTTSALELCLSHTWGRRVEKRVERLPQRQSWPVYNKNSSDSSPFPSPSLGPNLASFAAFGQWIFQDQQTVLPCLCFFFVSEISLSSCRGWLSFIFTVFISIQCTFSFWFTFPNSVPRAFFVSWSMINDSYSFFGIHRSRRASGAETEKNSTVRGLAYGSALSGVVETRFPLCFWHFGLVWCPAKLKSSLSSSFPCRKRFAIIAPCKRHEADKNIQNLIFARVSTIRTKQAKCAPGMWEIR